MFGNKPWRELGKPLESCMERMLHGTIAAWRRGAWTHALLKVRTIMRVLHGATASSRSLVIGFYANLKTRKIFRRALWLTHWIMAGRFAAPG